MTVASLDRPSVKLYSCSNCQRRQVTAYVCGLCGAMMGAAEPITFTEWPRIVDAVASSTAAQDAVRQLVEREPCDVARADVTEMRERIARTRPAQARVEELDAPAVAPAASRVVSLGSVTREVVPRVACNVGAVDQVFGGGVPLRVILLGGRRGTGKTTLALPICAGMARASSRRAFYYSAEGQSVGELAAYLPPEESGEQIDILEGQDLEELEAEVLARDPVIVVADSMQSIRVAGTSIGTDKHARALLEGFQRISKSGPRAVLALSQMNGEGGLRGSMLYQQLCNSIALLEKNEATRVRRLLIDGKNRGGPDDVVASFHFDENGVFRPVVEAAAP